MVFASVELLVVQWVGLKVVLTGMKMVALSVAMMVDQMVDQMVAKMAASN